MDYNASDYNSKADRIKWPEFDAKWIDHIVTKGQMTLAKLYNRKVHLNGRGVQTGSVNTILEAQVNHDLTANLPDRQREVIESQRAEVEDETEALGIARAFNQGARTVSSQSATLIQLKREDLLQIEIHKVDKEAEVAERREEQITARELGKEEQITAREKDLQAQITARSLGMEETKRLQAIQLTEQKRLDLAIAQVNRNPASNAPSTTPQESEDEQPAKKKARAIGPRPKPAENAFTSVEQCTDAFFLTWLRAKVPTMSDNYVPSETVIAKYAEDQENPFCKALPPHFASQKKWVRNKLDKLAHEGLIVKRIFSGKPGYAFMKED